jgi:hypothetical protein
MRLGVAVLARRATDLHRAMQPLGGARNQTHIVSIFVIR